MLIPDQFLSSCCQPGLVTGIENGDGGASGNEENSSDERVVPFRAAVGANEQRVDIELKVRVDFLSAMGIIFPCRLCSSSS